MNLGVGRLIASRFAPSPTGNLHLGGLRTCLYNYLLAKKSNGQFILRIENTDTARTVEGAQDAIITDLKWAGLDFDFEPGKDGSFGSLIQSRRTEIYLKYAQDLLDRGKAYKCFCTPKRLDELKLISQKTKRDTGYDRKCATLSTEEIEENTKNSLPFVVRFKVAVGDQVQFKDLVHSTKSVSRRNIDDFILLKSDGFPTYHLANVVDDHLMGISHVLRGEEWVPSTPKHILLYNAFGWKPPQFGHLPLLVKKDGSKLSKRQNDVSIDYFRKKGYLPEALLNFVAFLGWSPKSTREIYTLHELIDDFDISMIHKSSAIVSYDKLDYLNKIHISRRLADVIQRPILCDLIFKEFRKLHYFSANGLAESPVRSVTSARFEELVMLVHVITFYQSRAYRIDQFPHLIRPFIFAPDFNSLDAIEMQTTLNVDFVSTLHILHDSFSKLETWNYELIKTTLNECKILGLLKFGDLMKIVRYAITGSTVGVDISTIVEKIGQAETLSRISTVLGKQ